MENQKGVPVKRRCLLLGFVFSFVTILTYQLTYILENHSRESDVFLPKFQMRKMQLTP